MLQYFSRRAFLSIASSLFTIPLASSLISCSTERTTKQEEKNLRDPKLALLDLALQHEYGAVVQYANHAGILTAIGKDRGGTICETLKCIIYQEIDHAVILNDILKKNEIEPTIAVWPPQAGATPLEMLKKDIAVESGAIALYQQILEQNFDDHTKTEIEQILKAEQQHHQVFNQLIAEYNQ